MLQYIKSASIYFFISLFHLLFIRVLDIPSGDSKVIKHSRKSRSMSILRTGPPLDRFVLSKYIVNRSSDISSDRPVTLTVHCDGGHPSRCVVNSCTGQASPTFCFSSFSLVNWLFPYGDC